MPISQEVDGLALMRYAGEPAAHIMHAYMHARHSLPQPCMALRRHQGADQLFCCFAKAVSIAPCSGLHMMHKWCLLQEEEGMHSGVLYTTWYAS